MTKTPLKISKILSFLGTALGLVLIVQGGIYLSAATDAKGEILGTATSAYMELNSARENLSSQRVIMAKNLFEQAKAGIEEAQNQLNDYKVLAWLTPQGNGAHHLLSGANFLAAAGSKLTDALSLFDELKISSQGVETVSFIEKIHTNKDLLSASQDLLQQASEKFNAVGSIPTDYMGTFEEAKRRVKQLDMALTDLIGVENLYLNIFNANKTYLLLFQNYDEARATGGFIGTYGVLKTVNEKIAMLKIKSIYDLDSQIHKQIAAPGPLQPDIARWRIRDANWFADFPTSARKLLDFFELGGETADGVLALTPQFFEELLKLTGPIAMPEYDIILTADNFQETVQYKTSLDYDKVLNQPKKLLDDFAPRLLNRLSDLSRDQYILALQILYQNMRNRQVLMYSKNPQTQEQIVGLGISGKILDTDWDYLSINNSNLGGTKTDLKILQQAELKSKILSDGSIISTLQLTRTNQASEKNRDYLRILVPKGSQLISTVGFDDYNYYASESAGLETDSDLALWDQGVISSNVFVHSEAGKTEFSGWLETSPGETKMVTVIYILPFKAGIVHSLLVQKQSGSKPFAFKYNFDPGGRKIKWVNDARLESNTNTDDFWAFAFSK